MIRTWVKFQLEVLSILHIGSGEHGSEVQPAKKPEDQDKTTQLSLIVRDLQFQSSSELCHRQARPTKAV